MRAPLILSGLNFLRDQCRKHDVAFHFKQWGNWVPLPSHSINGHQSRTLQSVTGKQIHIVNIGKKKAGRRLSGREWNQLPRTN